MINVHCIFDQSWQLQYNEEYFFEKKNAKFDTQFITLQDIVFPRQYTIKIVNAVFVGIMCISVCKSSIICESFEYPSQLVNFLKDTNRKLHEKN